jgi:hypothetical protein
MTLQDALVAYQTYARAEGKSPKTVAWVVSSAGYFAGIPLAVSGSTNLVKIHSI